MIIDTHVHDPYIFEIDKKDPRSVAHELLEKMDKLNIEKIFLYALEADPSKIYREISIKTVYKGIEDAISRGIYHIPKVILESIDRHEESKLRHINILKASYTPTERIVKISRYGKGRIIPVGSMMIKEDNLNRRRMDELIRLGIKGLKIYPTIQFINPGNKRLYRIYDKLVERRIPLFIHTGCDPGLWELPRFCKYADPKNIEKIVSRYPDLTIILCHMGAYSALRPGIFLENAIDMVNKYDNVYGDIAALEPDIIKYIIRKVDASKILFGSDYPVTGWEWSDLIENIFNMDIPHDVKRMILYQNALNLFNL